MEWLLAIAGFVLNLFLPVGTADRYWQGMAHGAAIIGGNQTANTRTIFVGKL